MRKPSIALIADYFGAWPAWTPMFFASCAANPDINWIIRTDCPVNIWHPKNVRLISVSWPAYKALVSDRLQIDYSPCEPYSICNLRPMFSLLFKDDLKGFDYTGWCDIDVVFGQILQEYASAFGANVISSNSRICSGHLTLIKNECWLQEAFSMIPNWKSRLESQSPYVWRDGLDEAGLSSIFSPKAEVRKELAFEGMQEVPAQYYDNNWFEDRWVTPFVPEPWLDGRSDHPERWIWCNGSMTNERDAPRTFPYLHLMNFKNHRYINEHLYSNCNVWGARKDLINFDCSNLSGKTVVIDRGGFNLVHS